MNKDILFEEEQKHLKKGYDYIKKDDWPEAIEEFKKALELNPSNIWAHIELGKLYRNELKCDTAEKKFREVLNMSPDNEQAEQVYICLGEIHRMQGEYGLAMKEFEEALKVNPDNKRLRMWIERADQVFGFRKEIAPYRVFFTWGMHYQCNYKCSYCNTPKPEDHFFNEKEKNRAIYLGVQEWLQVWDNIYKKYGSCRIRLDGGEPSIYPSFNELVTAISQQHLLQINTNLSFDLQNFAKKVSPDRVRIDASFHPEFVTLEDFLHKILILNEHRFKIVVSCVAYPPFLERIEEYKQPFENLHIPFIIHPLSGELNGKIYPRDYEMEEISKIYNFDEASRLIMCWKKGENKTVKGKLCRMGQIYGRIYPNGDVYRCCADGGMLKLGNICEDTFQLLDNPLPCECENCPCWKCMIVGEEERWISQWLDDWEMPAM